MFGRKNRIIKEVINTNNLLIDQLDELENLLEESQSENSKLEEILNTLSNIN